MKKLIRKIVLWALEGESIPVKTKLGKTIMEPSIMVIQKKTN